MVKGIYDAARSMISRQKNVEITANNLANINTTGFKRSIPFSEIISREDGISEVQITDFSEGAFTETGNPLDLAVSEKSFFMVETEKGIELTNNGKLKISEDGYLINEDGYYVVTEKGRVNVLDSIAEADKNLKINKNGEIQIGDEIIDKLLIAKIEDQTKIMRSDKQKFLVPFGGYSLAAEGSYEVFQGYVEESNVNPIVEMQNLITINKDYQAAQKMVSSLDNIMGKAREVGRI